MTTPVLMTDLLPLGTATVRIQIPGRDGTLEDRACAEIDPLTCRREAEHMTARWGPDTSEDDKAAETLALVQRWGFVACSSEEAPALLEFVLRVAADFGPLTLAPYCEDAANAS